MIGPNDPPRLGVDSLRRGDLKFETKGCAVKGMRGNRVIALSGREGKFTVVNYIGSGASFK